MAETGTDVIMMVKQGATPLASESQVSFEGGDTTLLSGFKSGACCLLLSFSMAFGVEAATRTSTTGETEEDGPEEPGGFASPRTRKPAPPPERPDASSTVRPGAPQPVTFRRWVDCTSPQLFAALVAGTPLTAVSIIKRKGSGSELSGDVYLRLDFGTVLLTSLDWVDSEDGVEETGTFIYRKLDISYREQTSSGVLGAVVPGSWEMVR